MSRNGLMKKPLRWGLAAGFLGLLLYYGSQHAVTIQQTTVAMAKISLIFVVFVEVLDHYADMGKFYGKFLGGRNSILSGLIIGGVGFAIVFWALTGTLRFSGAAAPAAMLVAGFTALYIFAPDTGSDEWYFIVWLAANIATKFQYITFIPQGLSQPTLKFWLTGLLLR